MSNVNSELRLLASEEKCLHYRAMLKKAQSKRCLISREQFEALDFHRVLPEQLWTAIFWELARMCDWIVDLFSKWHETKLGDLWGMTRFSKLRRWKVRQAVDHFEPDKWPEGLLEILGDNLFHSRYGHCLGLYWSISPLFPLPFVKIPRIHAYVPSGLPKSSDEGDEIGFQILEEDKIYEPPLPGQFDVRARISLGIGRNSRKATRADYNAFTLKLEELWRQLLKTVESDGPRPHGMGATLPWHELRELVAFWFKRAGYSREEAIALLKQHFNKKIDGVRDVFPYYSAGGWSKAVTKVAQRMKRMDDLFQFLSTRKRHVCTRNPPCGIANCVAICPCCKIPYLRLGIGSTRPSGAETIRLRQEIRLLTGAKVPDTDENPPSRKRKN